LNISPPSSLEAFAELDCCLGDQFFERRLAVDQRQLAKIVSIEIEQIERHHHDLFGFAFKFVLEDGKVSRAVRCRDNYFAVDNRGPGVDQEGIGGHLAKTLGPVVAAAGEHARGFVCDVQLHPVAIELDFMEPTVAARHLSYLGRERRLDETGEGRLDA
jgi:hypothetical protein